MDYFICFVVTRVVDVEIAVNEYKKGSHKLNFKNKKILVVGLGVSGQAAVAFFLQRGACVTVADQRDESEMRKILQPRRFGPLVKKVPCYGGDHPTKIFEGQDLILVSPGVPLDLPGLNLARQKKIPIIGEFGLASELLRVPMIAVTGTNGKSTTVTLIAEILKRAGYKVALAGNIGSPLLEVVLKKEKLDWIVAEVSSYQLETVRRFRPRVSVLLNVTDDHLDRYSSFQAYGEAKLKIFGQQTPRDVVIFNADDPFLKKGVPRARARKIGFSAGVAKIERKNIVGLYLSSHSLFYVHGRHREEYTLANVRLMGLHNIENIMASIAAAREASVAPRVIQKTLEAFKGLPHRMQFVRDHKGVRYYEDSKATNVDAVVKALTSFKPRQVVLIAGGRDKGGSYEPLRQMAKEKLNLAILIGEARDTMAKALSGAVEIEKKEDLPSAIALATRRAKRGDVVLLSPACSSFDQFRDYKERGQLFQSLVKNL